MFKHVKCWFIKLDHSWDKDPLDTLTYRSLWKMRNHYESLTIKIRKNTENVKFTEMLKVFGI